MNAKEFYHKRKLKRLKEELKDNSILMSRMNTPNLVGLSAYIEKAPKIHFYLIDYGNLKLITNRLAQNG